MTHTDMRIKVAIFEDNSKFLEAITLLLDSTPDVELVGTFLNTDDLPGKIESCRPDIVLMDIGIAPMDGIDATRLITRQFPGTRVIIQTVFEEDNKVFAAISSGASGYILKNAISRSLYSSLLEVYNGGAPMTGSIASKVLALFKHHFSKDETKEEYNLSRKEKEVLKWLVDGCSYKMVADRCNISYETVKTHIKRIYEKLHVASMTEAVAKALRENIF